MKTIKPPPTNKNLSIINEQKESDDNNFFSGKDYLSRSRISGVESNNGSFKKAQRQVWSNHKIGSLAGVKDSKRLKANDTTAVNSSFNTPVVSVKRQDQLFASDGGKLNTIAQREASTEQADSPTNATRRFQKLPPIEEKAAR